MPLELGLVFLLGLVSSLHCVQMCGPIVLAFSLPLSAAPMPCAPTCSTTPAASSPTPSWERWPERLGGGIGMLGRLAGLASGARVFAGCAMIVAGILMIGLLPSNGLVTIQNRRHERFSQTHRPPPARAQGQIHARPDPRLPPLRPDLCRAAEGGGFRQRPGRRAHHAGVRMRAPRWRCSRLEPRLRFVPLPAAGAIAWPPSR